MDKIDPKIVSLCLITKENNYPKEILLGVLEKLKIDSRLRPENLDLTSFISIIDELQKCTTKGHSNH